MIGALASLFHPAEPGPDSRRWHWAVLAAILAAGAAIRFWHLGNVSLHGDEDIMGLAARGVLAHGTPLLPSGMTYSRAPLHTYLIAASMSVFGDNEWAIRFPSAVVGSLCGLVGFWLGRRFLSPIPNLAFAAALTFLPSMIEYSQTGRMYIFFIAFLLLFGVALFRWERNGRASTLALASLAWLVALQFHTLSVFAAPVFLFPGLSRRSWRLLAHGAIAFVLAAACFGAAELLIDRYYPSESDRLSVTDTSSRVTLADILQHRETAALAVAGLAVAGVGGLALRRRKTSTTATLCFTAGVAACGLFHYHLGALLLALGTVLWLRGACRPRWLPGALAAGVGVLAAVQVLWLHGARGLPLRKVASALVGEPSIWPLLRLAGFSAVGAALYAVAVVAAGVRVARRETVPVHFLFFAMSVWAPVLAIGILRWSVPPRYVAGTLPFFLLCVVAGAAYLLSGNGLGKALAARPAVAAAAWAVLALALIDPVQALRVARNDYPTHPDHRGAAEFVRSLDPAPGDIVIAEDSINQTYYLRKVDFRLLYEVEAAAHSVLVDGELRGQYTGTPVLGSGAALERVLDGAGDRQVYIIGSGENFADGRRGMRGGGIYEVLESDRLEVIYEGRDGRTKVWRLRK